MSTSIGNWDGFVRAGEEELLDWASEQPWAVAMRQCPQDAEWHAEGDVWTHTVLVFREVLQLPEYGALSSTERALLLATALFHDSGKPATTRPDPETGRLRSPKHSLAGAKLAREVLRDLGCPLDLREHLVALVRYHGRPPYLLEGPAPELEVIRLSSHLSNRLLHLFALADTRGRVGPEKSRPEEVLQLWRDLAEEHRCLDVAYPFANETARFLFHRGKADAIHYVPHEDHPCTVTMMSGLPGAGKDTWLQRNRKDLPVISLDAIREEEEVGPEEKQGRVIQAAQKRCKEWLAAGTDFAFNATNLTTAMRKGWIDLFDAYGARIEIVYLEPPLEVLFSRNRNRESSVPHRVMERLLAKLEVPVEGEAHRLERISA